MVTVMAHSDRGEFFCENLTRRMILEGAVLARTAMTIIGAEGHADFKGTAARGARHKDERAVEVIVGRGGEVSLASGRDG